MLLPFVLDGDKARMTATGRQGSQLMWLMSDGATGGGTRTGYLWVELVRTDADGQQHLVTCGIGIRHSTSAKTVDAWQFTVPTGAPSLLEPDGVPLSKPRCRELVASLQGRSFDSPREYKAHVGRLLFGLDPHAYDDLLRLLYWLRQPQVGEDLDPGRLVGMLDESLPALDEAAVRQVGEALDDLAAHGEQLDRLRAATAAITTAAAVYARYARTVLRDRAAALIAAETERATRDRATHRAALTLTRSTDELAAARDRPHPGTGRRGARPRPRQEVLEDGPLARTQQVLAEKHRRATDLARAAEQTATAAERSADRADGSAARVAQGAPTSPAPGSGSPPAPARRPRWPAAAPSPRPCPRGWSRCRTRWPWPTRCPAARHQAGTARAAVTVVRQSATARERRRPASRWRRRAGRRRRARGGAGRRPPRRHHPGARRPERRLGRPHPPLARRPADPGPRRPRPAP